MTRKRCSIPRSVVWLFGAFVLIAMLQGCSTAVNHWATAPGSPRVLTSFAPLYCFTKNVSGDGVGVLCLLSDKGPHEYESSAGDAIKLRTADLFVINGLGLEEFVEKLVNSSGKKSLIVARVGEAVAEKSRLPLEHNHAKDKDHAGHHHHGEFDPHVWLGIPEAKAMVEKIRDELTKVNPERKDVYAKNAVDYLAKLDALQEYGNQRLGKHRKVITMHDSMGYFAKSFGIDVVGSIQINPGEEPAGPKLAELIKKGSEQGVNVICIEPQYPRSIAETLRNGLISKGVKGVEIVEFDPIETAEPGQLDAGYYERRMRENIDNLAKHLK
jgi:zinc transport system substrate-binding protein